MKARMNNFLRETGPGIGTAFLMMLLYPFAMLLLGFACLIAVLPLFFAFGAFSEREYFLVPVWLAVFGGVLFAERGFYRWSIQPERSIKGFKEIATAISVAYMFLATIRFDSDVAHPDGGYHPVLFILGAPKFLGLALAQPFLGEHSSDIESVFNAWEAFTWCAIGVVCVGYSLWKPVAYRMKLLFFAGITFLVFGLSDVYEVHTGAWWDPVGLLIVKAACILAFITLYLLYRKDLKTKASVVSQ
jgi:hypothetical protein